MNNEVNVAIIGAGPYGLSLAAHLAAQKTDFKIFGRPMDTWINQMPRGMCLKSEGFASTLYDPEGALTLHQFCREKEEAYADVGLPVKLETFISYGLEFQRRLIPQLENKLVVSLDRVGKAFRLQLETGEAVLARRVVIAAGISHFQYVPPALRGLPERFVTHSSRHNRVEQFRGRDVTVVGGGASALDLAALLKGAGASVCVLARRSKIYFHNPPGRLPRPLLERVRAPMTGLGPGWRSFLCVEAPLLFHRMPASFRTEVVRKHLGPAAAWFIKEAVAEVKLNPGNSVKSVSVKGDRLQLEVESEDGETRCIETDHVIAGTGYRVDLQRLAFLPEGLREQIRTVAQAPVLSTSFESSVKGLYFVGAAAAPSFGPLLRFAYGAKFTARRMSHHLNRSASKHLAGNDRKQFSTEELTY